MVDAELTGKVLRYDLFDFILRNRIIAPDLTVRQVTLISYDTPFAIKKNNAKMMPMQKSKYEVFDANGKISLKEIKKEAFDVPLLPGREYPAGKTLIDKLYVKPSK